MLALSSPPLVVWLSRAVPAWVKRVMAGPETLLRVGPDGAVFAGHRRSGRPVVVELHPDLVLTTRLSLPEDARRDITEAAALRIESETPFAADEVLAVVSREPSQDGQTEWRFRIDMTPSRVVNEALGAHRIHRSRVRSVSVAGPAAPIHFPFRSRRSRIARWLLIGLPLLVVAAAISGAGLSEAQKLRTIAEATESDAARDLAALRADQSDLEAREARASGNVALEALLSKTQSALLLINELKRGMPQEIEIEKIEIAEGTVTLAIKAADVLQAVRAMNDRPGWAAATDGTIASDPTTGEQVATVVVRIAL